jgi:hypothetical protein
LIQSATLLFAQEKYYQIIYTNNSETELPAEKGKLDSANFILKTQQARNSFLSEGYLLSNIDKLQISQDSMQAVVNVGKQYKWHALGTDNIPEEMLSKSGYRQRDFQEIEFSGRQFNKLITKLLAYSSNSGYPFASLQLEDINVDSTKVKGILAYNPGPKILYDSLTLYPENIIKHRFLENYLRTREGTLFQLNHINQIRNAIGRLPYCQIQDSIKMSFENNLCNISLVLKPLRANKIDALIGFLPNQKQGDGLLISGYINLHLQNLFRSGKELSLSWRQFQQQSQILEGYYKHPNLFNSPLGFGLKFNLLKQDSTFLNTSFNLHGFYNHKKIEVSFLADFNNSRSLSTMIDSLSLPEIADYNLQQGGIQIYYNGLDDRSNPIKGSSAFTDFKIGINRLIKPLKLPYCL